ncbi:hypothetical protein [Terasakiella sp.]|uniref:hypothetical protein n=1 Tax=Terasakiella sp. TaxID=2034861 RepID=UPI003AA7DB68
MKPEDIITDQEIETVHANANFGDGMTKREVVNLALLKFACGFGNGYTALQIISEHGLVRENRKRGTTSLLPKGRKYLWSVYGKANF